jgi:hypothetical protein
MCVTWISLRVDHQRLGVPGQLLDAVLGHVAVAAEELHRFHRDLGGRLGGVELCRGLGQRDGLAGALLLDGSEHHVLHVDPGDLHLGQLQLDELETADLLAPERAALGVVHVDSVGSTVSRRPAAARTPNLQSDDARDGERMSTTESKSSPRQDRRKARSRARILEALRPDRLQLTEPELLTALTQGVEIVRRRLHTALGS